MRIRITLLLLAGCQAYRPLPLDVEAHERAWASRAVTDERVQDYAARLASLHPDAELAFDPGDGLALGEAELVALVYNPSLRVARLEARVPVLGAREAGRWDDPSLGFDLLRITRSVPDPWIVGASLSFTLPISGRLGVEKRKALAEADVEIRRARLAEWELIGRLRVAWARWSGVRERIALLEAYLGELDGMLALARRERAANRIGSTQLRVLELERVSRAGQLETLRIDVERRRLDILALLGLVPDAPVELSPGLPLDAPPDDPDARRAELREHNLRLTVARAAYDVADENFRLEIRKQYPDLGIGPAYENEEGASRIGLGLGLPLPLWNRNRRAIAESRAARDAAKAAFETLYEELVVALARAELVARAARTRSSYLQDHVAPLVDQQMQDLRRLAELGDLDVLVLLDALTRTLESKTEVLESKVEESVATTELRMLLRPLATPPAEVIDDEQAE